MARNLFAIIAAYDQCVRTNDSEDFPARRNVATCDEGTYGAWGEVLDMVPDCGPSDSAVLTDAEYDVLQDLFQAYQAALRVELGLDPGAVTPRTVR